MPLRGSQPLDLPAVPGSDREPVPTVANRKLPTRPGEFHADGRFRHMPKDLNQRSTEANDHIALKYE
jgi:hypothetical protein